MVSSPTAKTKALALPDNTLVPHKKPRILLLADYQIVELLPWSRPTFQQNHFRLSNPTVGQRNRATQIKKTSAGIISPALNLTTSPTTKSSIGTSWICSLTNDSRCVDNHFERLVAALSLHQFLDKSDASRNEDQDNDDNGSRRIFLTWFCQPDICH